MPTEREQGRFLGGDVHQFLVRFDEFGFWVWVSGMAERMKLQCMGFYGANIVHFTMGNPLI